MDVNVIKLISLQQVSFLSHRYLFIISLHLQNFMTTFKTRFYLKRLFVPEFRTDTNFSLRYCFLASHSRDSPIDRTLN